MAIHPKISKEITNEVGCNFTRHGSNTKRLFRPMKVKQETTRQSRHEMPSHNPTVQKQNSLFQKKINAREQLSSRNVGQHLKTDRGLFQSRSVGIIPKRFDCGVHPLRPRASMSSSNISTGPKNDRGTMNSTLRMVTFGTMR